MYICIYIYIYIYIYISVYVYIYTYKFTSKCHNQTTPSSERREPGPLNVFNNICWQAIPQLRYRVLKPPSLIYVFIYIKLPMPTV